MAIITSGGNSKKKGTRKGNPIRAEKGAEMEYRRTLFRLNRFMKIATVGISAMVSQGVDPDLVARQITADLEEANRQFNEASERIAMNFTGRISADNKAKLERSIQIAMGVDVATILDTPAVRKQINTALAENVGLIRSIPAEHFKKVEQAVFANFRGDKFKEGSLVNRLKKIGSITDRRAKLIARDQSAKFVTKLNAIRQEDAGIEGYIWRTQLDERVVGNPSGLYPKGSRAHLKHWQREGKMFKWNEPPPDGHPGQAINCRCFAEPVINIEKVKENAIKI